MKRKLLLQFINSINSNSKVINAYGTLLSNLLYKEENIEQFSTIKK